MKNVFRIISSMAVMALFPAVAGAVGTYYNGNLYQNPQQRYTRAGYYNSYGYGAQRGYGNNPYGMENQMGNQKQNAQNKKTAQQTSNKQGFVLDAGLSHEIGKWEFDMNAAGSKLHYDNLAWNVFDARGVYYFGDNTKMQLKAGFKYGLQFGDSPMIDDDISSEYAVWSVVEMPVLDVGGTVQYEDTIVGTPAMSVGTSKDGKQMGFNIAFGLTDFFTWGRAKITPSIGYRYFKHELTTEKNYGLAVDVLDSASFVNCLQFGDEVQCGPLVEFWTEDGYPLANPKGYGGFQTDENGDVVMDDYDQYVFPNNTGWPRLNMGGTYYYEQPSTSHKYETEWAGPYLALDAEYQINKDNLLTGGIEFGLPIYKSTGDQPYRVDWAHPTSVEDKGGFGDAYHFAMNAGWVTAISDATSLSLGFTLDYYKVSDAKAKTYLSPAWYSAELDAINEILDAYDDGLLTDNDIDVDVYEEYQDIYTSWQSAGWAIEDKKEVNSVYKSMGIRVGINMRF